MHERVRALVRALSPAFLSDERVPGHDDDSRVSDGVRGCPRCHSGMLFFGRDDDTAGRSDEQLRPQRDPVLANHLYPLVEVCRPGCWVRRAICDGKGAYADPDQTQVEWICVAILRTRRTVF